MAKRIPLALLGALTTLALGIHGGVSLPSGVEDAKVQIWVATDGNDSNPGTKGQPLRTLEGARDLLRERDGVDARVTVWMREGTYELDETVEFGAEDSGTAEHPVVYSAYEDEAVSISGGTAIPGTAAVAVTDPAVLARIPAEAQANVRQIDLTAAGITAADLGPLVDYGYGRGTNPSSAELFIDGETMTVARWPNAGGVAIAAVSDPGSIPSAGERDNRGGVFSIADERISRWAAADQMIVSGYFWWGWAYDNVRAQSIDVANKSITLAAATQYGVRSGNTWSNISVSNLIEEIDAPGEYFIDRDTATAYVYPRGSLDDASISVSLRDKPLLSFDSVEHLTVKGLTFENSRGLGVYIEGGDTVTIADNRFRNLGEAAVAVGQGATPPAFLGQAGAHAPASGIVGTIQSRIAIDSTWNRNGGVNHQIVGNDISAMGAGGIYVGAGDRKTLTASNVLVSNNAITDYNRWLTTSAPAVWITGAGVTVEHNLLHGADQRAIFVNGNLHLIRKNEIHNTVRNADDVGAVGMYRDPSEFGNVFENNFIHNNGGDDSSHGAQGIFLDDGTSGQIVRGNVFVSAGSNFAVKLHGGRHNQIENNIFVDVPTAVGFATWGNERWKTELNSAVFQKRLVEDLDVREPPFSTMYPDLAGYIDADGNATDQPTTTNVVDNNVLVRVDQITSTPDATIGDNFQTTSDPGFIDPENLNFGLLETSEVYDRLVNFEPIPFDEIGLVVDEYRTSTELALSSFDLVSPAAGDATIDATTEVVLTWAASRGADRYRVQVAKDSAFSDIVVDSIVYGTSSRVTEGLLGETTYYWRVEAQTGSVSQTGARFNESGARSFTTVAGDPESLSKPEVVATTSVDGRVDLSWQPVAGATSYDVYRKTPPTAEPTKIRTVLNNSFRDPTSSVLAGDLYTVVASNAERSSAPSNAVSGNGSQLDYSTDFAMGLDSAWTAGDDTIPTDWVAAVDESTYSVIEYQGTAANAVDSEQLLAAVAGENAIAARVQISGGATDASSWAGLTASGPDGSYRFVVRSDGRAMIEREGSSVLVDVSSSVLPLDQPHQLRLVVSGGRAVGIVDGLEVVELTDPAAIDIDHVGLIAHGVVAQFADAKRFSVTAAAAAPSLEPWTSAGVRTDATATAFEGGSYTLTAGGEDVFGVIDGFGMLSQQVEVASTQTLTVEATLVGLDGPNPSAMAGIMVRQSDAADSANVFARVIGSDRLQTTWRPTAAAATSYTSFAGVVPSTRIRLVKTGDVFTTFIQRNGEWVQTGTATVAMTDTVIVALAVSARSATETATAVFRDVVVSVQ